VPLPPHLRHLPCDQLQFTLVDCPGHASLIRTIIGGVQIIDMVLLVIDITKGGALPPPRRRWPAQPPKRRRLPSTVAPSCARPPTPQACRPRPQSAW
jgi:hypothetical protein